MEALLRDRQKQTLQVRLAPARSLPAVRGGSVQREPIERGAERLVVGGKNEMRDRLHRAGRRRVPEQGLVTPIDGSNGWSPKAQPERHGQHLGGDLGQAVLARGLWTGNRATCENLPDRPEANHLLIAARKRWRSCERGLTLTNLERHLERCAISLKPAVKREGVDAWFPYYAGYSPRFVREALGGLGAQPGWTVLDPWNGAGTTTAVADALGCDAVGLDINPVAALVAAARLERSANTSHAGGLTHQLLEVAGRSDIDLAQNDPLLEWLSPRVQTS